MVIKSVNDDDDCAGDFQNVSCCVSDEICWYDDDDDDDSVNTIW